MIVRTHVIEFAGAEIHAAAEAGARVVFDGVRGLDALVDDLVVFPLYPTTRAELPYAVLLSSVAMWEVPTIVHELLAPLADGPRSVFCSADGSVLPEFHAVIPVLPVVPDQTSEAFWVDLFGQVKDGIMRVWSEAHKA